MRILQPTPPAASFTTSVTTPLIIGGTAVDSTLSLRSTSGAGTTDAIIFQVGNNGASEAMRILTNMRVGIQTSLPTADLAFGGNLSRTIQTERHTTANTAGNNFTLKIGGATLLATDKNGGNLTLSGGTSTGTGTSVVIFQTATAGSTGTADNAPTTKATLTGSGNLGIGTTSPLAKLHVSASQIILDTAGNFATTKFDSQGAAWSTRSVDQSIIFNEASTIRPEVSWHRGSRTYPEFAIKQHTTADKGGQIYSGAGTAVPTMTMAFNVGKVGVLTSIPVAELHLATTATDTTRGIMSAQHSTGTDGAQFLTRKGRGTEAAPTTIVTGDVLGSFIASGHDGTAYLQMGSIAISSTGTIGTDRVPTTIAFKTATDAAPSVLTTALLLGADQSSTFTCAAASAIAVGPTGATNPAFQVDASTASGVGGLKITSNITTQGVTLSAIGTNANENLLIICKGAGVTTLDTGNSNAGTEVRLRVGNLTKLSIIPASTAFTTSARTSGATTYWSVTGGADTTLTASTEALDVNFNLAQTKQHATGALTLQRHMLINAPTDGFVGASVVTDDATLAIDGPPSGGTNATLTTTQALLIQTRVVANSTNAYGMVVNAPSGAGTINGAALFVGSVATTGTVAATGIITAKSATATTAGGLQALGFGTTAALGIYYGSGAPTISAAKGSIYIRSDGTGAADRAYINTDGGTTFTAIVTVA